MTPPRAIQPRAARRGFVFLVVLLLMVVGSILMAATLQRATAQHALVEKQIDGYRRHHELLGVRDIVKQYLLKSGGSNFSEHADTGEPMARLVLENGQVLQIFLKDGQGTVLRELSAVPGEDPRRWLVDLLVRLPPGRQDLTRKSGPWAISLRAAPDEVLEAIAGGDPLLTDALISARDNGAKDASELLKELESRGAEPLTSQAIVKYLVFAPNIWRLDVELIRADDTIHRFVFLVDRVGANTSVHEWRALPDSDEPPPGFGAEPALRITSGGRSGGIEPKTERQ